MKISFWGRLLAVSVLTLWVPVARSQSDPQGQAPLYNPSTQITVTGTVESVNQYNGPRFVGTHIMLNTGQGVFDVHLGPSWFLEQRNIRLAPGDKVQVTGSRQVIGGQNVLVAKDITAGGSTAVLRNEQGIPLWSGRAGSMMRGGQMQYGAGTQNSAQPGSSSNYGAQPGPGRK